MCAPATPDVVESWTHPDHVIVVNGAHDWWRSTAAGRPWHVIDDHGPTNLGCPTSWNAGFRLARELGHRYVVITSQGLLLHQGTGHLAELVAQHADDNGLTCTGVPTFHCVVFSVALWESVGGFDESFPIWCDMDFLRRVEPVARVHPFQPGRAPVMPVVPLDASGERCTALRAGVVTAATYEDDKARYLAKWKPPGSRPRMVPW